MTMLQDTSVRFDLPAWLGPYCERFERAHGDVARMRFVVDAARQNVEYGTGGPFAAAVFERDSGRLVALGVNLVVPERLSLLHAEIVALALAERAVGAYDLGAPGLAAHELVTSCEPCAMCLGAIPWAGVRRVVCAATSSDARGLGFDEGDRPDDWAGRLHQRGIDLVRGVERERALAVFSAYAARGGLIYNGAAAPR